MSTLQNLAGIALAQTLHTEVSNVNIFMRQSYLFYPTPKRILYYDFYIYLADKKLREFNNMQKNQMESHQTFRGNTIVWIEKLLQTPIDDYRKNAVNLILAPYLINIKKVSYDNALNIINSWLSKSTELRQLDQNFDYMVRYALKYSAKNGQRPLKLDTLKVKNKMLYNLLRQ
jgi:hypothetical protein